MRSPIPIRRLALEAINSGEIFRYINKPWELDHLRTDLKNALELSALRTERNELMHDKIIVQQSQLLSNRMASLLVLGAVVQNEAHEVVLYQFAQSVLLCKSPEAGVDWQRWEHADLLQAEAQRSVAIASHLQHWLQTWGPAGDNAQALKVLAEVLNADLQRSEGVLITEPKMLTALLTAPAGQAVTAQECAWLAWLMWQKGSAQLQQQEGSFRVAHTATSNVPSGWLANAMEQLGRTSA